MNRYEAFVKDLEHKMLQTMWLEPRRYEFAEFTDEEIDAYLADEFITQAERDKAAAAGEAMADGSYPIRNGAELDKAIRAVGRGTADHDSIRKHIIKRAKALGQSEKIPDNWKADGSLKDDKASSTDGIDMTAALDPSTLERGWHAYVFAEGLRTTDGRAAEPGAGIWRDLPVALEWQKHAGMGHDGAVVVGQINSIERRDFDGYSLLYAEGTFDLGGANGDGIGVTVGDEGLTEGAECARQVGLQGGTRFVSSVIEPLESDTVSARSGEVIEDLWQAWEDGDDDWYEVVTSYRLAKATVVATPAFPMCVIAPLSVALPDVDPLGAQEPEPLTQPMLVASMVDIREDAAPSSWFAQPLLDGPTPLQVTAEGRVYGHIADWRTPHTGYGGVRVYAPRNPSGTYPMFLTGDYPCSDGKDIRVGQLTMGCGHAPLSGVNQWQVKAHYDGGPGAIIAADVCVGEDRFGIWCAGAMRPGLTPAQIREFMALSPSGDWRKQELMAVVQVPVPGFPIPRALAAAGIVEFDGRCRSHIVWHGEEAEVVALVAAGRVNHDPIRDMFAVLSRRIAALETVIEANGLNESALAALEASLVA